ncbi:hypothetical protein E2C01_027401 [Portunus trituberculatus]|uniref:Uncharacterized protein n=1 Tax=Portunus trituberculatus TaxID=210409 RepID=A0A5B7EL20_PORTR|nr:hypothetical protein [Portunus trituberculatus]
MLNHLTTITSASLPPHPASLCFTTTFPCYTLPHHFTTTLPCIASLTTIRCLIPIASSLTLPHLVSPLWQSSPDPIPFPLTFSSLLLTPPPLLLPPFIFPYMSLIYSTITPFYSSIFLSPPSSFPFPSSLTVSLPYFTTPLCTLSLKPLLIFQETTSFPSLPSLSFTVLVTLFPF